MRLKRITVSRTWKGCADFDEALRDYKIDLTNSGTLKLRRRILLADEIGRIGRKTKEQVQGEVWIKKEFLIENPNVFSAEVIPFVSAREEEPLILEVNGREAATYRFRREWFNYDTQWTEIPFPIEYLRRGLNEFVFHSEGSLGYTFWIENSRQPNRSAKSVDGGKTWNYDNIGINNSCDGEYLIRLKLEGYPSKGYVTSPFIDVASLATSGPIVPKVCLESLWINYEGIEPEGTAIEVEARIGSTPSYSPKTWTHWMPPEALTKSPHFRDPSYHYLQWRVALTTGDPRATPELYSLTLSAELSVEESLDEERIKIREFRNEKIIRSSYSFAYQPYDEPRLKILRERYQLDWVVKGAKTEFEKFLRLADWVRSQWEDGWKSAINWGGRFGYIDYNPPPDGLLILELDRRKLALGMCTHYSAAFVQCCLAVGLQARRMLAVHATAEVWSNEYKKWILIDMSGDPDDRRKCTYHFERNGIPMSGLEAYKAALDKNYEGIKLVSDRPAWTAQERLDMMWNGYGIMDMRNDHLSSLEPCEADGEGLLPWNYDGWLMYESEKVSRWERAEGVPSKPFPWFTKYSSRDADFEWTLNQAELHLQYAEPGKLKIQIDTVTPNFDKFLVKVDEEEWVEMPSCFLWNLRKGINTLQAKPVNKFGLEGIVSKISLEYS
ncbi:MAG: transglutaminase-like domain-containing protein [Candidatus Bathyarchaeia archaeon]